MDFTNKEAQSQIQKSEASIWSYFLTDVAEIVLEFLDDVDMCGYLNCVAKAWTIRPTERTYSRLCHRIYLRQTEKKTINLHQWMTWRTMLICRSRLRTNGFYWLRTSYWKPPVNDRFWEDRIHEYIEVYLWCCWCAESNAVFYLDQVLSTLPLFWSRKSAVYTKQQVPGWHC